MRTWPRTGEKMGMSKLGNESEAHGSPRGLAEARGPGSARWKRRSVRPAWPRRPHPPLEPTARSPRGPDLLSSLGGSVTAFLPFLPPLQPPKNQAWSPARLRNAPGTGGAKAGVEPHSRGGKSSLQSPAPPGPLAGNLPSGRPALAPGSVLGQPRSPLPPPGASTQRDSPRSQRVPSGVQKACAHPPWGRVEAMPIDGNGNNNKRYYKTKWGSWSRDRPRSYNFSLQK